MRSLDCILGDLLENLDKIKTQFNRTTKVMGNINISLPESMKAFVEEQVTQGKYGSVSEYLQELKRERKNRKICQVYGCINVRNNSGLHQISTGKRLLISHTSIPLSTLRLIREWMQSSSTAIHPHLASTLKVGTFACR